MSDKKSWNKGYGKQELFQSGGSLSLLELDMVRLGAGESAAYEEQNKEYALILLGGVCSVTGDGLDYRAIGRRGNVFGGAATALYLPRNRRFVIAADTEVSIAVCKAPAAADFEPALIHPEDVIIKELGKDGWKRQAHFILDERIGANLLYVGEAYVGSGMWASYPPHKHDEDKMPAEGVLEEIYYYEFDRPQGFGLQRVYSRSRDLDKTYPVTGGDAVSIPRGYHPYVCAPGYQSYYLWIMAGKNRGFYMTTEEAHQWLIGP